MMRNTKRFLIGMFGIFLLSQSPSVECMQSSGNCVIKVSATITEGCSISSQSDNAPLGILDFGVHPALGRGDLYASFTSNSAITFLCTPGLTLQMSIDGGNHYLESRRLENMGSYISYTLYFDNAFQKEIGIGVPVNISPNADGTLVLPVYGALTLPETGPSGLYRDTLTVTITY